jgi:single-stranded-DNA-specific exonuclease
VAATDAISGPPEHRFRLEPFSYADARSLSEGLGLAEPVAVTLVRRGFRTVEQARAFLDAAEEHDPFAFDGMAEVVARLRAAADDGRRITVHGDYDVDGVCSTAILVTALRRLGASCDWYIPDRLGDGYGLTVEGVRRLAARGTEVLLTADCGITCPAEVAAAAEAGIEAIVTDHHPCPDLCATAVAWKLSAAIHGPQAVAADLDLVALATVADLVPLVGENRALVRRGLLEARRAARPGLRALCAVARIDPTRLDEGHLAFRLAPRINAAGRLYRADAGVELVLTEDEHRANAIAAELDRANRERQAIELEVLSGAERARSQLPPALAEGAALVLAGEGWHPGVVGIVASRLAERHWRPVVLIGLDGSGRGRGSGRSVPGFDLLAGLASCDEHLVRYGGHRAAAGLEIQEERIGAFREAFAAHADAALGDDQLVRTETVDAVVGGESLGIDVAEQLERLAPFGKGNPGVRLLVPAASVEDVHAMGEGDRHARFSLRTGGRRAAGVAFGANGAVTAAAEGGPVDVAVGLEVNEWNGAVEPRVVLRELYEPDGAVSPDPGYPEPDELWQRLDAELESRLDVWPPPELVADLSGMPRREVVERRGASGVAAVAALISSGDPVLVLCADALRRRELVERLAHPARFGGGEVALASHRISDRASHEAVERLLASGAGVALADWPALARRPALAQAFTHVVVLDPAPFAHLDRLAGAGLGFLHPLFGRVETELALRVHQAEWPTRGPLAALYGALREGAGAAGSLDGADLVSLLAGPGRYRRSPEAAARLTRVLTELALVRWHESGAGRALGVVSSSGTDLERSEAFRAYRARSEEGRRFLSERTQAR